MSALGKQKAHPLWGWMTIAMGAYPLGMALGVFPYDPADVHAPMWVIGAAGMVFIIAGIMIMTGEDSKWNNLLASIMCVFFGASIAWVSLLAPGDGFSGGIPFIPNAVNVVIARLLFGFGSLMCLFLAMVSFRMFLASFKVAEP